MINRYPPRFCSIVLLINSEDEHANACIALADLNVVNINNDGNDVKRIELIQEALSECSSQVLAQVIQEIIDCPDPRLIKSIHDLGYTDRPTD